MHGIYALVYTMNQGNPSEELPDKPDTATILAVLQLLRKYNLKVG